MLTYPPEYINTLAHAMRGGQVSSDLPDPWRTVYLTAESLCLTEEEDRPTAYKKAIQNHFNGDAHDIWMAVSTQVIESRSPRRKLQWAASAFDPQPPIDWIVDGLFSAGSVSVLYGDPGVGKTYALLDMGVAVALGEDWLDHPTKQAPVLFVDEESGPRRLKRRLHDVLHSHNADRDTPLAFLSLPAFNLVDKKEAESLQMYVKQINAKLVIIDALVDVMDGGDENSVRAVQPVFSNLRTLADEEQAAVVIIHHSNKSGGYRGSSAMDGAIDLMLKVEDEGDLLHFKSEKARDIDSADFVAMPHFEEGRYRLTHSAAETAEEYAELTDPQRHVLKYIVEHQPVTVKQVKANPGDSKPATAKDAVYDLRRMGYARRTDDGGRGTTAYYAATDEGQRLYEELGFGS